MAKNKTGLYIGLGLLGAGVLYLVTRKPAMTTTTAPRLMPGSTSTPSNVITQATSLVSTLSRFFGGGSSNAAPGTAAAFAPVSLAPTGGVNNTTMDSVSPAGGINYINPSAPSIPMTAPAASDSSVNTDGSVDTTDIFNSEA
jgi:hypothetical protein